MMMKKVLTISLATVLLLVPGRSFCIPSATIQVSSSSSSSSSSCRLFLLNKKIIEKSENSIIFEKVVTPEDMLDVASFRNNCTNPSMMIQKQLDKKNAIDDLAPIVDAAKVGGLVGVGAGVATYVQNEDVTGSLQNMAVVFGVLFGLLSISGKRVYVYTEAEAINRLTVDYVAMLKAGVDVGFVAKTTTFLDDQDQQQQQQQNSNLRRYATATNGVVAGVDCQYRSSSLSTTRPHVYVKNMEVDKPMQRRGIARRLMEYVERTYVKQETDADYMVLEVDQSNTAAIKLYEGLGFVSGEESRDIVGKEYKSMVWGRMVMTKRV